MEVPQYSDMLFPVKGTECGPDSRLAPYILLGNLQETADKGAGDCGFDRYVIDKFNACWIVLRMKLHIERLPKWRENMRIRTWSIGTKKLFFDREYEVFDENSRVTAYCTSTWILADIDTHKPLVPEKIEGLPDVTPQQDRLVFGDWCERIKALPRDAFEEEPVIIKYADYSELDHNHHVNNTRYLAWTYDALAKSGIDTSKVSDILISYISEVKSAEKVEIFIVRNDDKFLIYGYKNHDTAVFAVEITLSLFNNNNI